MLYNHRGTPHPQTVIAERLGITLSGALLVQKYGSRPKRKAPTNPTSSPAMFHHTRSSPSCLMRVDGGDHGDALRPDVRDLSPLLGLSPIQPRNQLVESFWHAACDCDVRIAFALYYTGFDQRLNRMSGAHPLKLLGSKVSMFVKKAIMGRHGFTELE